MKRATTAGPTTKRGWSTCGWITNKFFREEARQIYADAHAVDGFSQAELAKIRFADWLKDHYDENIPEMPGVYGDLLGGALSAVNWDEIARHHIDAVLEEVSDAEASA